jgi:hypothetical protein
MIRRGSNRLHPHGNKIETCFRGPIHVNHSDVIIARQDGLGRRSAGRYGKGNQRPCVREGLPKSDVVFEIRKGEELDFEPFTRSGLDGS